MRLSGSRTATQKAKRLRREMTLPEILLWRELRKRPGGMRFRKQHPTGPYVLDFYCPAVLLAIEVDGEAHERGNRPERDQGRDAWLAAQGVRTLRIPAAEVLGNIGGVLRQVESTVR